MWKGKVRTLWWTVRQIKIQLSLELRAQREQTWPGDNDVLPMTVMWTCSGLLRLCSVYTPILGFYLKSQFDNLLNAAFHKRSKVSVWFHTKVHAAMLGRTVLGLNVHHASHHAAWLLKRTFQTWPEGDQHVTTCRCPAEASLTTENVKSGCFFLFSLAPAATTSQVTPETQY